MSHVVPENIHIHPMEGYCVLPRHRVSIPLPPPPHTEAICHSSRNSNLPSYIALHFWAFETPPSLKIPIPSLGRVWIFSGTTHWKFSEGERTKTKIFKVKYEAKLEFPDGCCSNQKIFHGIRRLWIFAETTHLIN